MMATQNCLITAEGIFSLASSAAKKHLLLHPPPPPFAVCFSDTTLQHLIWRTPLSLLPRDHPPANLQPTFQDEFATGTGGAWTLHRAPPERQDSPRANSPLLSLDYHWRSLTSAYLHPAVEATATAAELKTFCRLTPGDWWGVGILLMQAVPQAPSQGPSAWSGGRGKLTYSPASASSLCRVGVGRLNAHHATILEGGTLNGHFRARRAPECLTGIGSRVKVIGVIVIAVLAVDQSTGNTVITAAVTVEGPGVRPTFPDAVKRGSMVDVFEGAPQAA